MHYTDTADGQSRSPYTPPPLSLQDGLPGNNFYDAISELFCNSPRDRPACSLPFCLSAVVRVRLLKWIVNSCLESRNGLSFLSRYLSIHPSIWQPITSLIDVEIRSEPKAHTEWRQDLIVDKNLLPSGGEGDRIQTVSTDTNQRTWVPQSKCVTGIRIQRFGLWSQWHKFWCQADIRQTSLDTVSSVSYVLSKQY